MIIIKINDKIRIQKYLINGIKIFLKHKDKWYCIKINEKELELLKYIINSITD